MRDFSHVRTTLREMQDLYSKNGLQLLLQEQMDIPVSLNGWMALTHTPEHVQEEIIRRMEQDIAGENRLDLHLIGRTAKFTLTIIGYLTWEHTHNAQKSA